MDDPLLSAGRWLCRVSIFAVFCLSVCTFSLPGTRDYKNVSSKMGAIAMRESDL